MKCCFPMPRTVADLPGQSALFMKVEQIILNLLCGYPLGAALVVAREPGEGVEIQTHRVLGQVANGHVIHHSFAQLCHGSSPSKCDWSWRTPAPAAAGAPTTECHQTRERWKRYSAPNEDDGTRECGCSGHTTPAGCNPPRNAAQFNVQYHLLPL